MLHARSPSTISQYIFFNFIYCILIKDQTKSIRLEDEQSN